MQHTNRAPLFGLSIDAMSMDEVVDACQEAIAGRRRLLIGVVNAAKVVKLREDEVLRTSLLECDVLLADGQSVVWASQILGAPLPERVAGVDLFQRLLKVASEEKRSVYLLGATRDVLDMLVTNVSKDYPGLTIAGHRDGYFAADESDEVADDIRRSGADMLFLGMTSPKKEVFLGQYGGTLGVPVQHGVGGSFDILAGITKRAPVLWQRIGCEWLYRLVQEPRRLWRRYLRTNVAFLKLLAAERRTPTPAYGVPSVHIPEQRPAAQVVVDLRQRRTAVPRTITLPTARSTEAPVSLLIPDGA